MSYVAASSRSVVLDGGHTRTHAHRLLLELKMVKQKPVLNILFLYQTLHDGYSFEPSQRAGCNETKYD